MLDPERGAWSEHAVSHFKGMILEALGHGNLVQASSG